VNRPPRALASPLAAALSHPRYEILPFDGIVDQVLAHVPPQIRMTITASPKQGIDATLAVAEELRGHGYTAVPHISARLVRDDAHLDEILQRLDAAGVREIFAIAGDAVHPGAYHGAAALLDAMGDRRAQFKAIGISGYPESHHFISDEETIEAMFAKAPMATHIISQICFDPATVATWVTRVRARGTLLPIWIGVPGSVDQRRLLRISLKVGLGESVRFLRRHSGWLRLAFKRNYTPTRLIRDLAPLFSDPEARVVGFHVYTFNELAKTERWRRDALRRLA
jgi:methylenetetrahydrofolate reductase (NADPH)